MVGSKHVVLHGVYVCEVIEVLHAEGVGESHNNGWGEKPHADVDVQEDDLDYHEKLFNDDRDS